MKCPKCGIVAPADSKFCPGCGGPLEASQTSDGEIERHIVQGQKIEAIKLYREKYGVDLKDAKEAVERMAAKLAPVTVGGKSGGCMSLVILFAACFCGALFLISK